MPWGRLWDWEKSLVFEFIACCKAQPKVSTDSEKMWAARISVDLDCHSPFAQVLWGCGHLAAHVHCRATTFRWGRQLASKPPSRVISFCLGKRIDCGCHEASCSKFRCKRGTRGRIHALDFFTPIRKAEVAQGMQLLLCNTVANVLVRNKRDVQMFAILPNFACSLAAA